MGVAFVFVGFWCLLFTRCFWSGVAGRDLQALSFLTILNNETVS